MKNVQRIGMVAGLLLLSAGVPLVLCFAGAGSQAGAAPVPPKTPEERTVSPSAASDSNNPIEAFAMKAPFVTQAPMGYPVAPPAEVIALLTNKKATRQTDHFAFLLEYGLRVHQKYLRYTLLSRELPLEENMMLAELVRLGQFSQYTTAHDAGWLNRQFNNQFSRTGYSSYQIYIWAKEHAPDLLDEKRFPNWRRIEEIMDAIDKSARNGVGGGMVCHYGCIP